MARAGHCSACGTNVWLTQENGCQNGHGPEYISGVYEADPPAAAPVAAPQSYADEFGRPVDQYGNPTQSPEPKKTRTGLIIALVAVGLVVCSCPMLVAIGIPVFNAASANARQRTCHSNMRTIEGAVEQYLAADPNNTRESCAGTGWVDLLVGPDKYIKANPQCPGDAQMANTDYSYNAATGLVSDVGLAAHPHF